MRNPAQVAVIRVPANPAADKRPLFTLPNIEVYNYSEGEVMYCPVLIVLQWKEKIMNTADMLIHVHPELDTQARASLERRIMECCGVDCAEFDHHAHPHSLIVKYDPDEIEGIEILNIVRTLDPVATRVGL